MCVAPWPLWVCLCDSWGAFCCNSSFTGLITIRGYRILVQKVFERDRFEKRSKNLKPRLKCIQQVCFPCLYRIVRVCTELSSVLSLIKDLCFYSRLFGAIFWIQRRLENVFEYKMTNVRWSLFLIIKFANKLSTATSGWWLRSCKVKISEHRNHQGCLYDFWGTVLASSNLVMPTELWSELDNRVLGNAQF